MIEAKYKMQKMTSSSMKSFVLYLNVVSSSPMWQLSLFMHYGHLATTIINILSFCSHCLVEGSNSSDSEYNEIGLMVCQVLSTVDSSEGDSWIVNWV